MVKKLTFKEKQAIKRSEDQKAQRGTVRNDVADVINNAAGEATKVSSKELEESKKEAQRLTEALLQQKANLDRANNAIALLESDKEKFSVEIADLKGAVNAGEGLIRVKVEDIELHPGNTKIYDDYVIDEQLVESIASEGLLDPFTLCDGEDLPFRTLAGNRRLWHLKQPLVQARIKELIGEGITEITAISLGVVSEDEQTLRLVHHNTYRSKSQAEKLAEAFALKLAYEHGAQIRARKGTALDPTSELTDGSRTQRETMDRVSKEIWGVSKNTGAKYFEVLAKAQEELGDEWKNHYAIKTLNSGVKMAKVHDDLFGVSKKKGTKWNAGLSRDEALSLGINLGLKKYLDAISFDESAEEKLLCQFLIDYTKDRVQKL